MWVGLLKTSHITKKLYKPTKHLIAYVMSTFINEVISRGSRTRLFYGSLLSQPDTCFPITIEKK